MKNLFFFLFSRTLWINVLIAAFVIAGVIFGSLYYLKNYTLHGESLEVPDFTGMSIDDLDRFFKANALRYEIIDSVYSDVHERGVVVNQTPPPESKVKKNRKLYLTVNATQPPMVTMRDMVGLSKRQAISMLTAMGLQVDSLVYQPDICLDCVLDQRYKGKHVSQGTRIQKGEKVSLVLGGGSEGRVLVPDLTGLTYEDARNVITDNMLTMGAVMTCDGCENEQDSLGAFVFRQLPAYRKASKSVIPMGSTVDLYLTTDTTSIEIIAEPDTLIMP